MAIDGKISFDELFDFSDEAGLRKAIALIEEFRQKFVTFGSTGREVISEMEASLKSMATSLQADMAKNNLATDKGKEAMLQQAAAAEKLVEAESKLQKAKSELILTSVSMRKEQEKLSDQFSDSVNKSIDLQKEIKRLQEANKELQKQNKGTSDAFRDNTANLVKLKAELSEVNRFAKNAAKETMNQGESYKQLDAMLIRLQAEYKAMSAAQRESAEGRALIENIDELDNKLKELDAGMGKHQRNVGNYESGTVSLRTELMKMRNEMGGLLQEIRNMDSENKKLTGTQSQLKGNISSVAKELQGLEKAGKGNSERANELRGQQAKLRDEIDKTNKVIQENSKQMTESNKRYESTLREAGRLQDAYNDTSRSIQALASDTQIIDGVMNATQGLVGAFAAGKGAAALFGDQNENLQKTFVKLQALMTIMAGLQQVQNMLQKQSAANQLRLTILQNLQNGLESKNIAIRTASIATTKILTAVQWAYNHAIKAFPLFWIIAGVTALIGAFTWLSKSQKDSADRTAAATAAANDWNRENERTIEGQNELIETMKARGATEKEVMDVQMRQSIENQQKYIAEIEKTSRKINISYKGRLIENDMYSKAEKKIFQEQLDDLRQLRDQELTNYRNLQAQKNIALAKAETEAQRIITESGQTQFEIERAAIERRWQEYIRLGVSGAREAMAAQLQALEEKENAERAKQAIEAAKRAADTQRMIMESRISIMADGLEKELAMLDLKNKEEIRKLREQARENELIRRNLNELINNVTEIGLRDAEALRRRYNLQEIRDLNQLNEIRISIQNDTLHLIMSNEDLSYRERITAAEDFHMNQLHLINVQMEADLKAVADNETQKLIVIETANRERNILERQFSEQRMQFLQNELVKEFEIREQGIQEQQNQLRDLYLTNQISLAEYNRERDELEKSANVRSLENQVELKKQLLRQAQETGEGIIQAQRELADAEIELQKELVEQKLDIEKDYLQRRKEMIDMAVDYTRESVAVTIELLKTSSERQVSDLERQKAHELSIVGDNAAAKEEIEIRYNNQIAKEKRRQAQLNKTLGAFDIAINTAVAITRALRELTPPLSIVTAAAYGVLGAAQLAVVLSKPIPAFRKGTQSAPEGMAVVSEEGQELWQRGGKFTLTPEKPSIVKLKRGDKIYPAHSQQTKVYKESLENIGTMAAQERQMATINTSNAFLAAAFKNAVGDIPVAVHTWDDNGYQKHTSKKLSRAKSIVNRNKMGGNG